MSFPSELNKRYFDHITQLRFRQISPNFAIRFGTQSPIMDQLAGREIKIANKIGGNKVRRTTFTTGIMLTFAVMSKSSSAYADATMTCPEIAMNMFLVPLELVQQHVPSGQRNNLAGPEGQAIVQVTSASGCNISVEDKDVGTADFVRVLARHKDDPEPNELGDGMYVPIIGFTNNSDFAREASSAFEFSKDISVDSSGGTLVSAKLPDGGKVTSKMGELNTDGGMALPPRDFYILREAEKGAYPDIRCSHEVVGRLTSEPGPQNTVTVSSSHPVLAAAIPIATLKVENIQCEYIQKN